MNPLKILTNEVDKSLVEKIVKQMSPKAQNLESELKKIVISYQSTNPVEASIAWQTIIHTLIKVSAQESTIPFLIQLLFDEQQSQLQSSDNKEIVNNLKEDSTTPSYFG